MKQKQLLLACLTSITGTILIFLISLKYHITPAGLLVSMILVYLVPSAVIFSTCIRMFNSLRKLAFIIKKLEEPMLKK